MEESSLYLKRNRKRVNALFRAYDIALKSNLHKRAWLGNLSHTPRVMYNVMNASR